MISMICTMICSCFTEDKSYCRGPEIASDTIVFTSIADCIALLVVSTKLYTAAASAWLAIRGRLFCFKTVSGYMKLPNVSANI